MTKNFDIITIGGATQDIMYYTSDATLINNKKDISKKQLLAFEYGGKIASEDVKLTFGGGGMNTAISCSVLGIKTGSFLNLGSDWFAKEIFKELGAKKVDTKFISFSKNLHSGFSFIINFGDYNEHIIFTHRGSNKELKINKNIVSKIKSKWFYISSLSGSSKLVKENLDNIFSSKNIKIAWNPGQSQINLGYKFFKKYLEHTEVIILNKDEAIELVKSKHKKTDNIEILLETIHSWGAKIVLITNGHLGAYAYDGEKIYYQKAIKVKSINTTGAGDAFGSSFVSGIILGYNIPKSLKFAMIRSSHVLKHIGAQVGLINK